MGKKIITIAEIAFAVVFIMIIAVLFRTVMGFGDNANNTLNNIQKSIEDAEMQSYDNSIVSGDNVVSTINKLMETKNNVRLSYLVDGESYGYSVLASPGSGKVYDSAGSEISSVGTVTANSSYKKYPTSLRPGDSEFISPVAEYESQLAFNANGTLVGIIFTPA